MAALASLASGSSTPGPRSLAPGGSAVLRRARARRDSAGAAMFVVAVTLGLLAAMGVYGLAATASDIRASGHAREAAQAQHAAEAAVIMTAQALGPGTAGYVVRQMQLEYTGIQARSTSCKSAKPYSVTASQQASSRVAEACMVLSPGELQVLSPNKTWENLVGGQNVPFTGKSLGDVPLKPYIRVELTNPIDWTAPAGYQVNGGQAPIFTQIRATIYTEIKPGLNEPAQILATGRGRLVVGPYTP